MASRPGGMMPGGMMPGPTVTENATVDDTTVPDEEGEAASDEEQAAYEEFVKEGFRLMYEGGKVRPTVLKLLDEDPSDLMAVLENAAELQSFNHVVALAAATALITLQVVRESGEKDGVIILHGGKAILEDLVEIAEKAGVREYSEEEMAQAARMAADLFREAAADEGLIDLDEAKAEWDEVVAADKEGRLGEILPQLANAQPPPQDQAAVSVQ